MPSNRLQRPGRPGISPVFPVHATEKIPQRHHLLLARNLTLDSQGVKRPDKVASFGHPYNSSRGPMRCILVIPARLASTRLPEKLLRRVGGKSVLQHTYEAACAATITDEVVLAVDHDRLADEVSSFGGRWIMTQADCPSGTDRIAEVADTIDDAQVFINVQGDEPEIDPAIIDSVGQLLLDHPEADVATAAVPIRNLTQLDDPNCVKIAMAAEQGRAVYFSRAGIPFRRDGIDEHTLKAEPPLHWHHLGLYAYRREFLRWFSTQPPSRLEQTEKLEQLRAIEAGKTILVARATTATPGIDTEQDLQAFAQRLESS